MKIRYRVYLGLLLILLVMSGCEIVVGGGSSTDPDNFITTTGGSGSSTGGSAPQGGETGIVTRVIDGDTIDVQIGEVGYRVRYVGVNTPESDEACYREAANANADLVDGQTVTLIQDVSNTDRYGRLLRFVYVGSTFVNATLVQQGYAEAVLYNPDDGFHDDFVVWEQEATNTGRGCHPTGIFNDNSYTR